MISRLQYSPATATTMHEKKGLLPSWETMFRFTNITLIISGIATSFFLGLPLLAAGLGTYGAFYFLYLLRGKAKNGSASDDDAQSLQTGSVVEKGKYEKALKKIKDLDKRIIAHEATIESKDGEIDALRRKIKRG